MYLELLKRDGSMEWALPYGSGYCDDAENLKPATASFSCQENCRTGGIMSSVAWSTS